MSDQIKKINEIKESLLSIKGQFTNEITARISQLENINQAFEIFAQLGDPSKPIDPYLRIILAESFESSYKEVNGSIDSSQLKINWAKLAANIDFPNSPFNQGEGVGIFYLLNTSNSANPKLSFVISRAKRVNIDGPTIVPVSSSGKYIMLEHGNDNGIEITPQTFEIYALAYKTTIKFKTLTEPLVYFVNSYKHPIVTFHDGEKFTNFYTDNFPAGSSTENLKIVVEHGASFPKNIYTAVTGISLNCSLHTAMIFFEKDGQLLLNNIDDSSFPFKNKGLNVGRLCPPECD